MSNITIKVLYVCYVQPGDHVSNTATIPIKKEFSSKMRESLSNQFFIDNFSHKIHSQGHRLKIHKKQATSMSCLTQTEHLDLDFMAKHSDFFLNGYCDGLVYSKFQVDFKCILSALIIHEKRIFPTYLFFQCISILFLSISDPLYFQC